MDIAKENKAIDLSHHLSELSKARLASPLKSLARYLGRPDLLMLAGGLPSPDYFPFEALSADVLLADTFPLDAAAAAASASASTTAAAPPSWFWRLFTGAPKTEKVAVPKYPADRTTVNLATALQYGTAAGIAPLQAFVREFIARAYRPGYADWATFMHVGNTDGWSKVVNTLMNPGEGFLTEEWTYPSAVTMAAPFHVVPVPVEMDGDGMRPDSLRKVLAEWDEGARGMKRPHVIYTVPVGQNPSGANMPAKRKKQIYEIAVEYDIIIVEDDPYYFQQEGEYKPKKDRTNSSPPMGVNQYIESLTPSFLRYDYQGRVIRMDTFSKTIAPGSRLGWFTCAPLLAERLERQAETTTQQPCGFGQTLIAKLLQTWGYDGYVRWLHGISEQYTSRRNYFIDALAEEFHLHISPRHAVGVWSGCDVFVASDKIVGDGATDEKRVFGRKQYFSFVPPAAGMFVWLKLHFDQHPKCLAGEEDPKTLESKLWVALAEEGVIFAPGWFFSAQEDDSDARGEGHFRISFSSASHDEMKRAVKTFRTVLEAFFA